MSKTLKHKWKFTARFRRHAYGWRGSRTAVQRVKEAVSEIKTVARKDPLLGAEGAVLFLEKVPPALEQVDSSSGAIGTAVNNAIDALVQIVAKAPADKKVRNKWLKRLWKAIEEDGTPYIELLPEHWGVLCSSRELASHWADEFIDIVRIAWGPDPELRGYYKGTSACLSCLYAAGRYNEILDLLDLAPHKFWYDRKWGVMALAAMGKKAQAMQYAEDSRDRYTSPYAIARACEEILLASGLADEAYNRYAIEANQKTTYLATFRAVAKKYPHKEAKEILADLVASTPGSEGKWFAAAKSAGLFLEAIELANRTPCDPKTLTRAARDMKSREPLFAVEAGMAALRWLVAGQYYEITSLDVRDAYGFLMESAETAGCREEVLERVRNMIASDRSGDQFVIGILEEII